jgi:hypothetical protein
MRVIDHEAGWWFLLEEDQAVFFHVFCEHGAIGFDFMLQLNQEELEDYAREGRAFISKLATEIEYSAPIARASTSRFKARRLSEPYSARVTRAIESWRTATSA